MPGNYPEESVQLYEACLGELKKVNQSHYRPGQAQRVLRKLVPGFCDNGTGW